MNKNEIESTVESLLVRICNGVIAHPADLEIVKSYSGNSLTKYNIRAHAADAPRLMGKGGERFRSIRFIIRAAGGKLGRQMNLESLLKPTKGEPEPFPKFRYNPKWPKHEVTTLLQDTCDACFRYPVNVELVEALGSAICKVTLDPREPLILLEEATPVFQNLFSGIGVTNGCQLSVDIGTSNNNQKA